MQSQLPTKTSRQQTGDGVRLLIVEDEESYREPLAYRFRREGYQVLTASSGDQGLDVFLNHPIDIAILDVMLPGLDGLSLCRTIRKHSHIPIIMVSAKGTEFDKVLGLELGADDYVTKPYSFRELLARVHAVLRRHGFELNYDRSAASARPHAGNAHTSTASSTNTPTVSNTPIALNMQTVPHVLTSSTSPTAYDSPSSPNTSASSGAANSPNVFNSSGSPHAYDVSGMSNAPRISGSSGISAALDKKSYRLPDSEFEHEPAYFSRNFGDGQQVLHYGEILLDSARHIVQIHGKNTAFPLKEFEVLEYLMRHKGLVVPRAKLIERVWGADYFGDTKTLDVHIKRIRAKIEPHPSEPRYITTVRGVGYRFDVPQE